MPNEQLTCDWCGNNILDGQEQGVNDNTCCSTCVENAETCDCCGELYAPNSDGSWGGMCPPCAENHFVCDSCEETYSNSDYGADGLCEACYNEHEGAGRLIKEYHDGAKCGVRFLPNHNNTLYFGVELETDYYNDKNAAAEDLTAICQRDTLFWLEQDASLAKGIEIITQPCTLAYHRDIFPWENIIKIVEKHGGRSHDTTTCGLHIHFSRAFFRKHPELYQLRLIYLFEKFWNELVIFSRRDASQLEQNAKKYGRPLFNCRAKRKMRELQQDFHRYQAVNIRKRETIEIRIFRGTLILNTILASLELVDFLVRLSASTSTKKLQELTWKELKEKISSKQYSYLNQYLAERRL